MPIQVRDSYGAFGLLGQQLGSIDNVAVTLATAESILRRPEVRVLYCEAFSQKTVEALSAVEEAAAPDAVAGLLDQDMIIRLADLPRDPISTRGTATNIVSRALVYAVRDFEDRTSFLNQPVLLATLLHERAHAVSFLRSHNTASTAVEGPTDTPIMNGNTKIEPGFSFESRFYGGILVVLFGTEVDQKDPELWRKVKGLALEVSLFVKSILHVSDKYKGRRFDDARRVR